MTIEDANTEYYVEVEASEIPSKIEVVSAIASIEEQEDPNDTDPQDPNYDPQDPNYDPNDNIENIEVTERKFDVKYAEDTGKSFLEALILALVNPQYEKRLFIEFPEK